MIFLRIVVNWRENIVDVLESSSLNGVHTVILSLQPIYFQVTMNTKTSKDLFILLTIWYTYLENKTKKNTGITETC